MRLIASATRSFALDPERYGNYVNINAPVDLSSYLDLFMVRLGTV